MKYNRDKVRKAVAAYVYFLLDNAPKDKADAAPFDSKRKALHMAIFKELTSNPDSWTDQYISEGLNKDWKAGFGDEENYIDYHTDRLIDIFHNEHAKYGGIELDWESKERIDFIIRNNKTRIGKRIAEVDKVMKRAQKGLEDYNDDHQKFVYSWNSGINIHDWNGLRSCIDRNWEKMDALAALPREAYTKLMVNTYLKTPIGTIEDLICKLEAIAFRAERTKYYTYEKKGATK